MSLDHNGLFWTGKITSLATLRYPRNANYRRRNILKLRFIGKVIQICRRESRPGIQQKSLPLMKPIELE